MRTKTYRHWMLLQMCAGITSTLSAQTHGPQSVASKAAASYVPLDAIIHQNSNDAAKAAAKRHDWHAAENALTDKNISQQGTVDWHIETTHRFIQLAFDLSLEGSSEAVPNIAAVALQHLSLVDAMTTDGRSRGRAKALAGFIYQRLFGDSAAAISSYKEALKLAPDDKAIQLALSRLVGAEAILRAKIHPIAKP